jgi:hypothetical protein
VRCLGLSIDAHTRSQLCGHFERWLARESPYPVEIMALVSVTMRWGDPVAELPVLLPAVDLEGADSVASLVHKVVSLCVSWEALDNEVGSALGAQVEAAKVFAGKFLALPCVSPSELLRSRQCSIEGLKIDFPGVPELQRSNRRGCRAGVRRKRPREGTTDSDELGASVAVTHTHNEPAEDDRIDPSWLPVPKRNKRSENTDNSMSVGSILARLRAKPS